MRLLAILYCLLAALFTPARASAQTTLPSTQPVVSITFPDFTPVSLGVITVGPGPAVYELFGHNVLVFFDDQGRELAYNWGVFNFEDPGFLSRFVMGRMRYQMQPTDVGRMIADYTSQDRAVTFQQLSLTPTQVALAWNWCQQQDTDATRNYTYDYAFATPSTSPPPTSFRQPSPANSPATPIAGTPSASPPPPRGWSSP
jgi:Domain of unknown function (DUF4105)